MWAMNDGVLKLSSSLFLLLAATAVGSDGWAWLNPKLTRLHDEKQWLHAELGRLPPAPAHQAHEHAGFHSGITARADAVRWIQIDLGEERALDAVVVIPAMLGAAEAHGFPRRFRIDASNDPLFAESTTLLDQTHGDVEMPLAPWYVPAPKVKARHVRFTATKLVPKPRLANQFIFCLGELLVFSGGRNVALHAKVLAPKSVETLPTWSPKHVVDGCHALGLPLRADNVNGNGWHSAIFNDADSTSSVRADFGSLREIDQIRLIPAHPRDYPDRFGFGFPRRFKVEADEKIIFDSTTADFTNPGDTPVAFSTPGLRAQSLQITATRLWERSGDFVFALAELQAFTQGQNIAPGATVTSSDNTITAAWNHANLVDGRASAGVLLDEAAWLADLSKRREFENRLSFLDAEVSLATLTAQVRAAYVVIALVVLMIVAGLAMLWHLRRSRRLEMEALRQRISRDLHDEIGSHLGTIRLMSELALREGGTSESLEEIHRLAGEAAESMRGIIWLVREGDAPKLSSLVEAIRQSAAALLKGLECHFEVETADEGATASLEFHRQVFLLFREAAHNIARHAQATDVKVRAGWTTKHLQLLIEDNGRGFDVDGITAGNGLANLRHRSEVLGGELKITSGAGSGTRVALNTPLS
jgi:signal transduction histidine kinase